MKELKPLKTSAVGRPPRQKRHSN